MVTESNPSSIFKSRATRGLAAAIVLIDLFVVAMAWRALRADREGEVERAGQALTNLARVLSENLEGTIAQIDLGLLATVDALEEPDAHGAAWRQRVEQDLGRSSARLPFIEGLRVTDATGRLVLGKGLDPKARVDVSDRDYFLAAKAAPRGGMTVSSPLVGRVSRKRSIIFARAWRLPDGAFAGVATATVTTDALTRTLARVEAPYDGAVVLRGADNAVIARYPDVAGEPSVIGKRKISAELERVLASPYPEALFGAFSPVEHRPTLNAFRRVAGSPFYVMVTAAPEVFLGSWRAKAWRTAAAVVLFTVLTALAAWVLLASLRSESETRFRSLVLEAPIAVALVRDRRILFVNRAFLRTFDLAGADQALNRTLPEVVHPQDVPAVADRVDRRVRALPVDATLEMTAQRQDGTSIRVEMTDAAVDLRGGPAVVAFFHDVTERRRSQEEREQLIRELQDALADVKTLSGLLPICSHCKKIRDDRGYWSRIETYIRERSDAEFTHGICPDCARRFYGEDEGGSEGGAGSAQG